MKWSKMKNSSDLSWRHWPPTDQCVHFSSSNSSQCPFTTILKHSSSKDLFLQEQRSVSHWLDFQHKSSLNEQFFSKKRRLLPFEYQSDSKICSNEFRQWILKYEQFHKVNIQFLNNRSIEFQEKLNKIRGEKLKFLIYEKHSSGLSDRIVHLITTYLVALLTNRLLIFDSNWPEFSEVFQTSLNFEQNVKTSFFHQLNLSKINLTSRSIWFSFDRFRKDYHYEKDFPEDILIFRGHTGGVVHTIHSNTSFYKKYLTSIIKINEKNLFGCLFHSLIVYRLSQLIKRTSEQRSSFDENQSGHSAQFILQTLLSQRFYPIGLQIRAGDRTFDHNNLRNFDENRTLNKYQNYFRCAQNLLKQNKNLFDKTQQFGIVYLLSDDLHIRLATLKYSKFSPTKRNKETFSILTSSNPVYHITYSTNRFLSFELAVFDIFLFSLCEQHVISTESGFGRFSVFISLRQRNIYSLLLNEDNSCENQSLSLEQSAYHWSGI